MFYTRWLRTVFVSVLAIKTSILWHAERSVKQTRVPRDSPSVSTPEGKKLHNGYSLRHWKYQCQSIHDIWWERKHPWEHENSPQIKIWALKGYARRITFGWPRSPWGSSGLRPDEPLPASNPQAVAPDCVSVCGGVSTSSYRVDGVVRAPAGSSDRKPTPPPRTERSLSGLSHLKLTPCCWTWWVYWHTEPCPRSSAGSKVGS